MSETRSNSSVSTYKQVPDIALSEYSEDTEALPSDASEVLGPQGDSGLAKHLETRRILRPINSDENTESGHGSSESIRSGTEDSQFVEDGGGDDEDSDSGWDTDLEIEDDVKPDVYDATGKNMYLKACKDIGVVPASTFLRHISSPVVNMKHHGLGPKGAKAISMALVTNTSVTTLDLEDNWIEGDGGAYVAEMLKENCYIASLDMSENKLRSKGAKAIGEMLQQNTCLKKLQLRGNEFKDRDARFLTDALKSNYFMKELVLNHNEFGEVGGEILGEVLLTVVNPVSNARKISLKKLDLSWNGFGDEGALAMAEALKFNSSVEWIDLSNNRVTDEGALVLSKGIEVNDVLKTLKLTLNPLTAAGAMALLLAIEKNTNSSLQELDLTGIVLNRNVMEVVDSIRSSRPGFNLTYHGAIGQFEVMPDEEPSPVAVVQDYLRKNNLRVFDLFRAYDKDKNLSVSREEFKKGIEASGMNMKPKQFNELVAVLDKDNSGEIDFSELLVGHNDEKMKQRTERKQKMIIAKDNRRNRLYAPVAEQFSNLKVKELKRPISPDRRSALKDLIKKDVSQWDQDGHKSEKLTLALRSLDQTLDFSNQGNTMTKEELLLSKSIGPPRSRSPSPLPRKDNTDTKSLKQKSPSKKGGAKKGGTKPKKKSTKKKLYKPKNTNHYMTWIYKSF
ncbi:hypothetical protein BSL78_10614 [Apostichopus japonicus]|uniref:EF-hand domain-containing protein n=1 Tax=Stichopus japonicus TaxID=307972 RepID=A0A2G8KWX6_STIJA|nr:hypothetical protein BSL78_10614 [Apostichopus japonicus]